MAIAAAVVSLLGGRMVRPEVALAGRLAPTGELLPVRGLDHKVLAAHHGYAQRLVVPAANEPDAHRLSDRERGDLDIVFAATLPEALDASLTRHQRKDFTPPA